MLTLGTVTILARVIAVLGGRTILASVTMTAKNGRATVTNIVHHPAVTGEQLVLIRLLVSWPKPVQDVGQFYHGVGSDSGDKSAIRWSMTAAAPDWAARGRWV